VGNLVLPPDAPFQTEYRGDLLGGVVTITGRGKVRQPQENGQTVSKDFKVTAIPYYAWAHRGKNKMAVWLPESNDRSK